MSLENKYIKYPRTFHLPWSEGATKDDRFMTSLERFKNQRVIITEKMDGENSSFYNDYYHARSLEPDSHWSKTWAKNFHAKFCGDIPYGWRICAENLYATHSIKYRELDSFIKVFSIWNENNICLSWDETVNWCELIGLSMVPVLYDGIFNEEVTKKLFTPVKSNGEDMEGYVVRIASEFNYGEFSKCVGKFVRKGHVITSHHWKDNLTKNKLKNEI